MSDAQTVPRPPDPPSRGRRVGRRLVHEGPLALLMAVVAGGFFEAGRTMVLDARTAEGSVPTLADVFRMIVEIVQLIARMIAGA